MVREKLQVVQSTRVFCLRIEELVTKKKLNGLTPRANYTDRATAACRRS
jgi:hypothetical protein